MNPNKFNKLDIWLITNHFFKGLEQKWWETSYFGPGEWESWTASLSSIQLILGANPIFTEGECSQITLTLY
jgi:hypothetical protein